MEIVWRDSTRREMVEAANNVVIVVTEWAWGAVEKREYSCSVLVRTSMTTRYTRVILGGFYFMRLFMWYTDIPCVYCRLLLPLRLKLN